MSKSKNVFKFEHFFSNFTFTYNYKSEKKKIRKNFYLTLEQSIFATHNCKPK